MRTNNLHNQIQLEILRFIRERIFGINFSISIKYFKDITIQLTRGLDVLFISEYDMYRYIFIYIYKIVVLSFVHRSSNKQAIEHVASCFVAPGNAITTCAEKYQTLQYFRIVTLKKLYFYLKNISLTFIIAFSK